MARVQTNEVTLGYAKETTAETAIAFAANAFTATEPNEISSFGATITTVAREPISNRLQQQKGAVTNLEAAAEFSADVTMAAMLEWLPPAVFAKWQNEDVREIDPSAATSTAFTVPAFKASDDGIQDYEKFPVSALIWSEGFGNAGNNGLRSVTTAATASGVSITSAAVAGNFGNAQAALTAETAPDDARVSLAGYRIAGAGSTTNWAYSSSTRRGTLTATSAMVTAMKTGLKKGQFVHLGSVKTRGGDIQNAVGSNHGFARYTGDGNTAGTTLEFDRVSTDLRVTAGVNFASNTFLDVVYGDFLRNVNAGTALYDDASHTLALLSTDLYETAAKDAAAPHGVELARGAKIGPLALTFAVNDKATFTASFTARDVQPPAATAITDFDSEVGTTAYSTVADFARIRMDVDEDGITSDFTSLTLTIDPQISGESVLGTLGSRYVNRGNLLVTAEAEIIFAADVVPKAIRENSTASFDVAISNDNGVLIFDVPSMTIGGGTRSYPRNEAVKITATGGAFEDSEHASSIMISQFFVPIPTQ